MFYAQGFDHALDHLDQLDKVWKWAASAGAGPGHWHEDAEGMLFCFFSIENQAASNQQPAAVPDVEMPRSLEILDGALQGIVVTRRALP